MPILKKKMTSDFTVVHNTFARDYRMDIAARGLLFTMLTMKEGWHFSIKSLSSVLPDGEYKVAAKLREIEKCGYLRRDKVYKKGKISEWVYNISDEPVFMPGYTIGMKIEDFMEFLKAQDPTALNDENLYRENQDIENLNSENEHAIEISSKEISSCRNINHINQSSENEISEKNVENSIDMIDWIDKSDYQSTLEEVKEQLNIEALKEEINVKTGKPFYQEEQIHELAELIAWTKLTSQKSIYINGTPIDIQLVRDRFEKLEMEHISYVLDCLMENTTRIAKRRNYLLSCLYNAPSTIDGYYQNRVQHDMYGGT